MISRLSWDSDFFNLNVGKVLIGGSMDPASVKESLDSTACDVVYVSMENPTAERLERIEEVAPLYDIKLTYQKRLQSCDSVEGIDKVVPYQDELSDELLNLGLMSGEYSRFSVDPKFRPYFNRLYKAWMLGSLSGTLADRVFVYLDQSRISGFITVAKETEDCGQIGLVAVHPDSRGKGVAKALLARVDDWLLGEGCKEIIVVTQEVNHPACRLYESWGYDIGSRIAICHYWK